jgi:hypothetical protein
MRSLDDHGDGNVGFSHARQHAKPVEIRHDKIEYDGVETFGLGANQQFAGSVAALDDGRPVAKPLDHCFEQAPLDWVVVDDKHYFSHYTPHARLCRIGAMSPVCLNGLLSAHRSRRYAALGVLKTRWMPSPRHEPCLK